MRTSWLPRLEILVLAGTLLFLAPAPAAGGAAPGVPLTPLQGAEAVRWLAIAPEAIAPEVRPLVDLRSRGGLAAALASTESIARRYPGLAPADQVVRFIRDVDAAGRARGTPLAYVLLAGDVPGAGPGVATGFVETEVGLTATDDVFARLDDGDALPDLAVGRLPGDAEAVRNLVRRTIAYETDLAGGTWQRDVAFVAGEGHFGAMIDRILEDLFREIITREIPAEYDVDMTYANPGSIYCYPPSRFAERVSERLSEGALVFAYVGHGAPRSVDTVTWQGRDYDVLSAARAATTEIRSGSPIAIMIACSTGRYDLESGDCVGEALLHAPGGAVAFVGASRVSQPYANGVLAFELVRSLFRPEIATVGAALLAAKRAMMQDSQDPLRLRMDTLAAFFLPPDQQRRQRAEHAALYNLLGDPALPIRRPTDLSADIPSRVRPGATLEVHGRAGDAPGAHILLTLECPRGSTRTPIQPPLETAPDFEDAVLQNYQTANDPVLARAEGQTDRAGRFELSLAVPPDLAPGPYTVKLVVVGNPDAAVAAGEVEVTAGGGTGPRSFR